MEDQIRARIAELEANRAKFVHDAQIEVNRQIAAMDGAIAELKALVEPEPDEDADDDDAQPAA